MKQHELAPPPRSKHRRKRLGRGNASGHGTYSGRGVKGQKSRSGGGVRPTFEGGQLPLVKRMPHTRGFTNIFRIEYTVINVDRLESFPPNAEVTPRELYRSGLVRSLRQPIKVLGTGEITKPLKVTVHRFSSTARSKIEAAGGVIEELTKS